MLSIIPTTISTTNTSFVEPISSPKQLPSKSKNSIKGSSHIITTKGCPPTLDIFTSRHFRLRHHKKYSSPFTQLQTILTTAPISKFKSPTTIYTTTATKPPLKSKISPPTSPQSTPTHSTSVTDKHLSSEKDITPTTTTTITSTATTTIPPTKIPAVMSINTSTLPRFYMPSSGTSSIMIPLSPSILPAPIFPWKLQELQQLELWGMSPLHQQQSKEVTITWQF